MLTKLSPASPYLDKGQAPLPVPVDHDGRGGANGGVHGAPRIAHREALAELLAGGDLQAPLVDLVLGVGVGLKER